MRVQVLVPVIVVVSLVVFGLVKVREKKEGMEEKRSRFQDIKLRVSSDVLAEYMTDIKNKQQELERSRLEIKTSEETIIALGSKKDEAMGRIKSCTDEKVGRERGHGW